MQGFSRWREDTTTSPSGRHIGLYKASIPEQESEYNIFETVASLYNACSTGHYILQRWLTVHCLMLEKIPGTPRLDKLRVIQIFEADFNLAMDNLLGRKMVRQGENMINLD
jgi:hypothetical protein